MRCRHSRTVENWRWFGGWVIQPQAGALGLPVGRPDAVICLNCKHPLPLGPSNDAPPEVQIEIRAAELAAGRKPPAACVMQASPNNCVRCGWENWWADEPASAWLAGYLARCIATHQDGEP